MRLKNLPREMYPEDIDRFYRLWRSLYEDVTVAMHWDGTYRDRYVLTQGHPDKQPFYPEDFSTAPYFAAQEVAKHMKENH